MPRPSTLYLGVWTLSLVNGELVGRTSIPLVIISVFTLHAIPFTIDMQGAFEFELTRQRDGAVFRVPIAENVSNTTWLFFMFALPWMNDGWHHAMEKVASHLYRDLASQGAFEPAPAAVDSPPW